MTNRHSTGRLELEVADFGPIVDANIDLRPLTVFVGPSNTGKSYLAILIYALHRFFFERSPRYGPRVARTPWLVPRYGSEELSEAARRAILGLDRLLDDRDAGGDSHGIALPEIVAGVIRRLVSNTDGADEFLGAEIARCFGVSDTGDLVRLRTTNGARVALRNQAAGAANDADPFLFSIALTRSRVTFQPSLPPSTPIRITGVSDQTVHDHLSRLRRMLSLGAADAGNGDRYGWNVLYDLAEMVLPYVVGPLHSPAFYLPADRAGVMHAHHVVVSTLVERAAMVGLRSAPRTPMMSGILADFLEELIKLDEPRRRAVKSGRDLGGRIEQAMLRGSIGVVRSESDYPSFVYRPDDWKNELPLMNASSMVSELAPVVLYLRNVVRAGDLLIIEEPESHLHPEMQAVLARELAGIVRAGIRIIVTTHSEWFLEQIGNLVQTQCLPMSDVRRSSGLRPHSRARTGQGAGGATHGDSGGRRSQPEHEATPQDLHVPWKPDLPLPANTRDFKTPNYGLPTFADLFTSRQLVALTTFSDLVEEAMGRVRYDSAAAGLPDDGRPLRDGSTGATAYAEAVAVYLAFVISKVANIGSSIASWMSDRGAFRETFARQAIPMVWDYAEANPLADAGGSFRTALEKGAMVTESLPVTGNASSTQSDAATQTISADKLVSTDPPYYDNIGYAELSDFFYVWLRRSQRLVFPELFATLAVPKAEELIATPYRHGGKEQAEAFFLSGMTRALGRLAKQTHPAYPIGVYYAFKQSEGLGDARIASTGWATFLEAVMSAGLSVSGTWPIRTEGSGRILAIGSNALSSSIVLVCRRRPPDASIATRRDFTASLKTELPAALSHLQRGNIAPVDLAQAAIGPGMAVYTRYAKVLDASGKRVSVGEALALINQTLDEILAEQEGDFDADSRWALAWFEQHGFDAGDYGIAETLSKAKNTSVEGMVQAGIVRSQAGSVRLLRPRELPLGWDPVHDDRLTTWEAVHHLIRVLEQGGESAAAALVRRLGGVAEVARDLCYRLYTVCERKKRAAEALAYNGLVRSWLEISRLAKMDAQPEQTGLFDDGNDKDAVP